jgi:hypothetical protein
VLCFSSGKRAPVVPAGLLPLELAIDREAFGVGRGRTAGSPTGPGSIAEGKEGDGGTESEKCPCAVLVGYAFVGCDVRPFTVETRACCPRAFVI